MGAWGTSISSNDTFSDIYENFYKLYDDGLSVNEISKKLINNNQDLINDLEDRNNFWFALAKAQWECKQLDSALFEKVKQIIETETDLVVWRELDVSEKEIQKRRAVLDKFLSDLQIERPKIKSRKKKIIRQPVFQKGDCLIFKLENGNYGGAVVLEAIKETELGLNLIAATRINQLNKPTKSDLENAEILVLNYASWNDKPTVKWYHPIRHKKIAHLIEVIDNIGITTDYNLDKSIFGFIGDFEIHIIQAVDQQFESEKSKPRSLTKLTVKELTKKVSGGYGKFE